jgi:RNA polymerase sigma-70 factor (ECF subfamily)
MSEAGDRGGAPGPGAGPSDDESERREFVEIRRRVSAAVRRHCPGWLAGQAEDIVQNSVLRLLRTLERSDGNRTFSSVYLEKSVCGAVVDEIRRACRRREQTVEDIEAMSMEISTARAPNPEHGASSREVARGIVDCLQRLAKPRRMAVALYLHGCTVPEAAGRLGWTLRKTESLVYRGLANLRTCLDGKGLRP